MRPKEVHPQEHGGLGPGNNGNSRSDPLHRLILPQLRDPQLDVADALITQPEALHLDNPGGE
jgi:hypothetical protein